METSDDSEGHSYGQLVIGSFIMTMPHLMCHFLYRVFWQNIKSPGDSVPSEPTFGSLWLLTFPKTKITFDREEISLCQWDSGKYDGTADGEWENCVRSQCAYFEGAEVSLSYVQCFLYLVSSSINVSIFHTAWLDTFWTELYTSRKEEGCFPRGQLLFSVWSSDAPFYIFLGRTWTASGLLLHTYDFDSPLTRGAGSPYTIALECYINTATHVFTY